MMAEQMVFLTTGDSVTAATMTGERPTLERAIGGSAIAGKAICEAAKNRHGARR